MGGSCQINKYHFKDHELCFDSSWDWLIVACKHSQDVFLKWKKIDDKINTDVEEFEMAMNLLSLIKAGAMGFDFKKTHKAL